MTINQFNSLHKTVICFSLLLAGILAMGPSPAQAEHYTVHEQTLVSGAQITHGMNILHIGVGTSSAFSLPIAESWSFTFDRPPTGSQVASVTCIIEEMYADGQVTYALHGTMVVQKSALGNIQIISGMVNVIGGTGMFFGAGGTGRAKYIALSDGHFTASVDAILNIRGQK